MKLRMAEWECKLSRIRDFLTLMHWKTLNDLIKDSMAAGEFENLPGKGQPLDLDEYFATPEDWRVGMKMVKDAGFRPSEVEIQDEILTLRAQLKELKETAPEDQERLKTLRRRIMQKDTQLNIIREQRLFPRRSRRP